ncbi:MAG: tryptophan--tRNA ligase [Candidatus Aminicenantes bacterium]|nr:MAG: tryptophan--tRNA ligase [Candidatus Aminicenantes bacterium]
MAKRLFSGIQPSGDIHIGNYLGAIRNWVSLIPEYECIYCVVDYHAITMFYEPAEMQELILNAAAVNIACGIDPEKCTLFVQSHVPEHTELAWILNTVTPLGDLQRMTQFKEKAKQQEASVNAGLLNYPVLMAADILLYKGEAVPVGEDQVQHLEITREIARRFNTRYGKIFPEPQERLTKAARIMGLDDPSKKMSKSVGNTIGLLEDPESIWEKVRTGVTDPARKRRSDPGNPKKCNIFHLHQYFSNQDDIKHVDKGCRSASIGCLDCKKILFERMMATLNPIREHSLELMSKPGQVWNILRRGAEHCSKIAAANMKEVKKAMGLL